MESKQIAPETTEAKEYISGQSRDHNDDHKVTHLYYGTFDEPGWPMCVRGWNRDDGTGYSIWRGNISPAGLCKICQRRAALNLPPIPRKTQNKEL